MILSNIEHYLPGDYPRMVALRDHIAKVCNEFIDRGLADQKFEKELACGSEQKFWSCVSEALVAHRLRDKQFGKHAHLGKGPDFLVMDGSRKVWVEVVCPTPTDVPAAWLKPPLKTVVDFPHEAILLRWTSAIKVKTEALVGTADGEQEGYLRAGLVGPDDAYVIAVNGCRLRSGPFPALIGISQFPFAAEAVFPIGPYQLTIDRTTMDVVESGHQLRTQVLNKNKAEVPTYTFLDPRFNAVSAIWAVDLNGGSAIGNAEPSVVIHNPNAINPITAGFLPADDEYSASIQGSDYVLTKVSLQNSLSGQNT